MNSVIVTKRGADRVRKGHLWIYRSDIVDNGGVAGGSVVSVSDPLLDRFAAVPPRKRESDQSA